MGILTEAERRALTVSGLRSNVTAKAEQDPLLRLTDAMLNIVYNNYTDLASSKISSMLYGFQNEYRGLLNSTVELPSHVKGLVAPLTEHMVHALEEAEAQALRLPDYKVKYILWELKQIMTMADRMLTMASRMSEVHFIMGRQCQAISKHFGQPKVFKTAQSHFLPLYEARDAFYDTDESQDLQRYAEISDILFSIPRVKNMLDFVYGLSERGSQAAEEFAELQQMLEPAVILYSISEDS